MYEIDMEKWNRKQHFNFFNSFDYPHFNISLDIDISILIDYINNNNLSFFKTIVYFVTKNVNEIEEFKYRIIEENQVVLYEKINPSFTIMGDKNLFSFCNSKYFVDYNKFISSMNENIKKYRNNPVVSEKEDKIDSVYLTSIPWIKFNSISHPIEIKNVDSVPRIAWGKYVTQDDKVILPFSVQVHHALMDGYHVSKYINSLQDKFNNPSKYI